MKIKVQIRLTLAYQNLTRLQRDDGDSHTFRDTGALGACQLRSWPLCTISTSGVSRKARRRGLALGTRLTLTLRITLLRLCKSCSTVFNASHATIHYTAETWQLEHRQTPLTTTEPSRRNADMV